MIPLLALLFPFVGCAAGGQAGALDECEPHTLGACEVVETCCNQTDCYFLVDGQRFSCGEGKACDDAIADVEAYCSDVEE